MIQKAQASMEVQVYLVGELRKNTASTEDEIQKFKRAAEEYMIKQIVKVKLQDIMVKLQNILVNLEDILA